MPTLLTLLTTLAIATSAIAADAATVPAKTPARPRILVLAPTSSAFDGATIATVTGLMIVELSNDRRLDVISTSEVQRLAELEGEKQNAGCADTSCLAELAGAMGARYVVFGDIGQLGSLVVMNLNLFDSQTAQALSRVTVQADGIRALPAALPKPMQQLAAPLLASVATTETPVVAAPAMPEASVNVVPWIVIGGGVGVLAIGAAVDVLSPTSSNGEFDGVDLVGPIGYVVGSVIGVTGVSLLLFGGDDEQP